MSGAVLEGEGVKGVFNHSASHPSYISMLATYRKLLLSAYGPKGSSVLISNAVGREVLVSSSAEIVKELSFSHPTTKYINALMSAQNTSCGLNGLYTGLLCTGLLEEAIKCEEEMPHPIISSISEWIVSELVEKLDKFPAQVVMDLNIGEMDQVVSFVKTILGSKSCLGLSESETNELSINIVRAFLKSIPGEYVSNGFGQVSITTQDEGPSSPGGMFEGVLYRNVDIPLSRVEEIARQSEVKLLLFTVALSYTEDTVTINWGGQGTKEENFGSLILTSLVCVLRKRNVSIIANQKAIHPALKFELEREGYLVLERLGTNMTDALVRMSGCRGIGNLSHLPGELNDAVLGTVTSVRNVVFNNKDYILLDHQEGCVATLLLPTTTPSVLSTLKETTKSSLAALRMAVVDGKVVCGGGCLEAWAAHTVSHLIINNAQHLTLHAAASPHHIYKVGNIFIRILMELSLHLSGGSSNRFDWSVDTVFHHLWYTPPNLLKANSSGCSTSPPSNLPERCVCGLLTQEMVKCKYNGWWKPVEYQISNHPSALPSQCRKEGQLKVGKWKAKDEVECVGEGEVKCEDECEDEGEVESLGQCTEDSLEGYADTSDGDEDVDSLEKSLCSAEEEIDSLEGKLESFDIEEFDSLENILDRYPKLQDDTEESKTFEVKLERHVSGALYDSFAAKFNATRLAFEGFTQLLHIGHCIFDK